MFIRALTFLLLLVLPSVFCRAQNCVMFTRDDGLSSTLVRFLFEDSGGMMWVATENGLNRYDGSRFTQYYHDPADPNSLAGNFVNSIYEDSRGRLFVCTHSGVQLYDPFTDSFSPAALLDGQPSGQVSAVTERSGGELWAVGNTLSAIHVDGDGLSLSRLPLDAQLGYADYAVEDKDFNFWVVKHNKGVFRASPDGGVTAYLEDSGNDLLGIVESLSGDVLALSYTDGLMKYDAESDSFSRLPYGGDRTGVRCFQQVSPNFFFLGTDSGIRILNLRSGNCREYLPRDGQVNLNKFKVYAMCRDKDGNLSSARMSSHRCCAIRTDVCMWGPTATEYMPSRATTPLRSTSVPGLRPRPFPKTSLRCSWIRAELSG